MKYKKRSNRLFNYDHQYSFLYIWYKYHYHFFRSIISRGNKLWAFNFFVQLKYYLKVIEEVDPVLIFFFAITNITPEFLLFPLKMAGIVNEVAMPISFKKQIIFAVKWAIKLIKTRYRIISYKQLCLLFLLANREKGIAMKKKLQTQQEAIRNRYLVRYFK